VRDDDVEVIFVDEDDEPRDAVWPEDERVEAGRGSADLPPHASRHRLLVTLVVLAALLGGVGSAFAFAYHRHVTDRRLANELDLAAATPPQIPGLAALNLQPTWHAELTERIVIPVVNRSPRAIVLLGAMLREPGMAGDATLTPTGTTSLEPGQTGTVTGEVTVDCTQDPAANFPFMDNSNGTDVPMSNTSALRVRARTSGGRTTEATVNPDAHQGDLQERICTQQGDEIIRNVRTSSSHESGTRTATVNLSVPSNADIALQYKASFTYSVPGEDSAAACTVEAVQPKTPTTGTLRPDSTATVTYTVQLSNCPAGAAPPSTETVELNVVISIGKTQLNSTGYGMSLSDLL